MKKIFVGTAVLMLFVFGCGKMISPTGPSEARAADKVAKSSAEITPILNLGMVPFQTTVKVGDEVILEATVENAVDLFGMGTTIAFDRSKLDFVRIEEGWFIRQQNQTSFMSFYNATEEQVMVGLTSLGKVKGVSGNGNLFRITFKALSPGQTELKFVSTDLKSFIPGVGAEMKKINFESRPTTIVIE